MFRAGFGRNPVEYARDPVFVLRKPGITVALLGFLSVAGGVALLLRSSFLFQLVPPTPSWLIYVISGTVLCSVGLFFAIVGLVSVEVESLRSRD